MVMRKMRELTPAIFLVVVLAFVGLMVFEWGMDISGQSSGRPQELGRVNGTSIRYEEWSRVYDALTEQARAERGRLTDEDLRQLREAAWDQLVTEVLIQQELRRLGIRVTDEEIRAAFRTAPPPWLREHPAFQTDGRFDAQKYREYFTSPAADRQLLLQIENYYRSVLPRIRLMEQLSTGIVVTDAELWQLWRDRTERVRVEYVVLDPRVLVPDESVSVSDAEVRRFYEQHRKDYGRPAQATLAAVSLLREPSAEDTAAAIARARALRDSVLAGADFAELVRRHSADPGSREAGGELGWVRRDEVVGPLADAAFALRPGQVSEPVVSPSGVHLVRLLDRRGDSIRVAHLLLRIGLTEESELRYLEQVDRLETLALRRGLRAAADSLGLPVRQVTVVEGSTFVAGVGELGSAVEWALHDSTAVGDVSPLYENDAGYHIFELLSRRAAGLAPLDEVRASVERRLLTDRKKERVRRTAEAIVAAVRNGASLRDAAAAHRLEVRTSPPFTRMDFVPDLGQMNEAIGVAFGLPEGAVSDVVEANDRFYVLRVLERIPPDRQAFEAQKEVQRAQLANLRRERQWELHLRELRRRAEIRDFRDRFFRPT
jgi:peptidyl-prolyl cis-trans isomerase D